MYLRQKLNKLNEVQLTVWEECMGGKSVCKILSHYNLEETCSTSDNLTLILTLQRAEKMVECYIHSGTCSPSFISLSIGVCQILCIFFSSHVFNG